MKKRKISIILIIAILCTGLNTNVIQAKPYDYKKNIDNNAFENKRSSQPSRYRNWGIDGNNFYWKQYKTHNGTTHNTKMEGWMAVEYAERGPETMEETIPDIVFPVDNGYKGEMYIGREVRQKGDSPKTYDPHDPDAPDTPSDWPYKDFEPPTDAELIQMMMYYINQGDWRSFFMDGSSETFAQSGCLACSVAMILSYLTGSQVKPTDLNKYINSDALLDCKAALAAYGYGYRNITTNVMQNMVNLLQAKSPCIVHIRGQWGPYHTTDNGHFLVAYGYDSGGIYVMDPGKRKNHYIPYEEWSKVNDLYVREVYPLH